MFLFSNKLDLNQETRFTILCLSSYVKEWFQNEQMDTRTEYHSKVGAIYTKKNIRWLSQALRVCSQILDQGESD